MKWFAGMCRGCPDLSKWVGGVSGFGRKILRWPEKVTGGGGWVGRRYRERRKRERESFCVCVFVK